jgi:hypothetical protein
MSEEADDQKEAKPKSRVSYPRELKSEASLAMKGLVTVSVTFLDGTKFEHQQAADIDECQAAKWFAVLLGRKDVRPLPSAEASIRAVCESKGISE